MGIAPRTTSHATLAILDASRSPAAMVAIATAAAVNGMDS